MNKEEQRKQDVDFVSRLNGYGSLSSAQTNNLRGVNTNLNGTPAPKNKDHFGITFFTRPDLNMSYDNLSADRMMAAILGEDMNSMARALRVLLDPRGERVDDRTSNLVDTRQAFIPVLSNNLISMSGWPDMVVDTYTSKEGAYKEAYSMVDGTSHIFNTFDITANFQNIQGDPITLLFALWIRYASLVYDGTMSPYPDNLFENRIDYQTRIYRLVLNEDWTHVQKIAACGAAFPIVSPLGAAFNYSSESQYNDENDQLSISFRCIGANYLDPILIKEFNLTVVGGNRSMSDGKRSSAMKKVSRISHNYGNDETQGDLGSSLFNTLSHKLYPRVDPYTLELEWWAMNKDYDEAVQELQQRITI